MADNRGDDWINEMLAEAMLGDEAEDEAPIPVPEVAVPAPETVVSGAVASETVAASPAPVLVSEPLLIVDDDPTGVLAAELSDTKLDVDSVPNDKDAAKSSSFVRGLVEWIVVLVGAVVVALLLRTFLFQAFWIPSESMEATLQQQDRVLVNKLSYRLHDVNRGDVIVFRRPDEEQAEIRDLIKRVIALPGESVEARENSIYINGAKLIEPYLAVDEVIGDFGPITVPAGEVFVMGDNRDESYDSRFFGTVADERIVGRAFVLFWPLNRIGTL